MTERFRLNEMEKASPLWRRLHAHLQERLDHKRRVNDIPHTPEETAALRGEIATLKYLVDFEKPLTIVDGE